MSENGNNKTMFTCPHCGQRFGVVPPKPEEPLNTLRASIIVAPHEKPIRCQNAKCAKVFIFTVTEAQLVWNILALTDEQAASFDERIIVAPILSMVH